MDNIRIKDLEETGIVNVPYPSGLREKVEEAMEAWRAFCALPENERAAFPYLQAAGHISGVGYELKKTEAHLDRKEDFHLTLGARDLLLETAGAVGNEEAPRFVNLAEDLIEAIEPVVLRVAQKIEDEYHIPNFVSDVKEARETWVIRFLHYFGDRGAGEEIAVPHADKCCFTLHLYESDPGLEHLTYDGKWEDMPVSTGETAIIPGMKLQYRSQNKLKATSHRVVATENTAQNGRFSSVCFITVANTPAVDKARVGPMQAYEPGFNYDMPFEEFRTFFAE